MHYNALIQCYCFPWSPFEISNFRTWNVSNDCIKFNLFKFTTQLWSPVILGFLWHFYFSRYKFSGTSMSYSLPSTHDHRWLCKPVHVPKIVGAIGSCWAELKIPFRRKLCISWLSTLTNFCAWDRHLWYASNQDNFSL